MRFVSVVGFFMNEQSTNFKFRFSRNGSPTGFRAKTGMVLPHGVELAGELIAYEHILQTDTRDEWLVLAISPKQSLAAAQNFLEEGSVLVLQVSGSSAATIQRNIDRGTSAIHVEQRRQELAAAGKSNEFHAAVCPHCRATVDLSELDRSGFIFCYYCSSIFNEGGQLITNGDSYRICEECAMFDRVKSYTEFYFYFLLVVYGWSSQKRHVCDQCAHGMFLKTLAANAIFLIGVPNAISIKIRSMSGRDPNLKELARANALALKGKIDEAIPIYRQQHDNYQGHPGLLYNEAIGYLIAGREDDGVKMLEASMKLCSNYWPTLQLVQGSDDQEGKAE